MPQSKPHEGLGTCYIICCTVMWYVPNSFRTQIWISFLDVATQKNIRIWHLKRGEFYSFFRNPSTHFLDTLPAKPKSTRHRIHYNRALWGCHNLFIWMFFEFHIHNLLFLFAGCQLLGGNSESWCFPPCGHPEEPSAWLFCISCLCVTCFLQISIYHVSILENYLRWKDTFKKGWNNAISTLLFK